DRKEGENRDARETWCGDARIGPDSPQAFPFLGRGGEGVPSGSWGQEGRTELYKERARRRGRRGRAPLPARRPCRDAGRTLHRLPAFQAVVLPSFLMATSHPVPR